MSTDRNRDLAAIHCAKRDLGLDDETYRAMLWAIGRVRSAGDLDHAGRKQVLAHLRSNGARFPVKPRRPHEWSWVDTAAPEKRAMLRKIIMLAREGGYDKHYVDATCVKMFGIERVELVAPDQLHKLVAALAKHQGRRRRREGAA
jgi:phage gp16-like protein